MRISDIFVTGVAFMFCQLTNYITIIPVVLKMFTFYFSNINLLEYKLNKML